MKAQKVTEQRVTTQDQSQPGGDKRKRELVVGPSCAKVTPRHREQLGDQLAPSLQMKNQYQTINQLGVARSPQELIVPDKLGRDDDRI